MRLYLNRPKRELPGRSGRRKALAARLEQLTAAGTQLAVLQRGPLELPPTGLSRQQAAAQRAVGISAQFQLPQSQVQSILAAGEHVVLFVRHDKSISVKGPG